jgi:hypothetical protein
MKAYNNSFDPPALTIFVRLAGVVLTPFPFVILGRDWLQNYYMFLNGPEQEFALGTRFKEILESLELS